MKGMFLDDSMSNLTSASNEASLSSSSNKNEVGTMYPPPQQMQQSSLASVPINSDNQTQTNKKKRNLPGNPGKPCWLSYVICLILIKSMYIRQC